MRGKKKTHKEVEVHEPRSGDNCPSLRKRFSLFESRFSRYLLGEALLLVQANWDHTRALFREQPTSLRSYGVPLRGPQSMIRKFHNGERRRTTNQGYTVCASGGETAGARMALYIPSGDERTVR